MTKPGTKILSSLLILCLLLPAQGFSSDDKIHNLSVETDGNIIEIRYDLLPDREDKKYTVTVEISDDGGRSYDVVPHMITGDLGRDILPGRNKRIIWIIERDFPDGFDIDRYDFRITAAQQGMNRNILYIIAGTVLAGGSAAAYFLLGGDNDDDGFPQPPGRPD